MYQIPNLDSITPHRCPCCEDVGTMLWQFWKTSGHNGVVDGRLRLSEIQMKLMLFCEQSGDTIVVVEENEFDMLQSDNPTWREATRSAIIDRWSAI